MESVRRDAANGSCPAVWDQAASHYDEQRLGDPVYLSCIDQAVTALGSAPLGRCLDAGCGTGMSTLACVDRADLVVAVDFSHGSLLALKAKAAGKPVLLVQADVTRLPFREGAFDNALCANTLQHLRPGEPQERAVAELSRVTAPAGRVVVSVHHYSRAKRKAGWVKEGKPGQAGLDYIFRFSRTELVALMRGAVIRAAGFYDLQRVPGVGRRLQNVVARIGGRLAAALGFGHMLVAVSKGGRRHD